MQTVDEDEALAKLDAYLCDVKDMQISDGLHIWGEPPAARAALLEALADRQRFLTEEGRLGRLRQTQAEDWLVDAVRERFGREGLKRAGRLTLRLGESPFSRLAEVMPRLLLL